MKCMFSTRNLQVRAKDRQVSVTMCERCQKRLCQHRLGSGIYVWPIVFLKKLLFAPCGLILSQFCTNSIPKASCRSQSLLCTHSITCQGLGFLLSPSQAILSQEFRWNLGGAVWETEIYSKNCRSYCAGFCCSLGCYSLSVTWVSVAPHLWHFMGSQLD